MPDADPLDELADAARDEWTDPVITARRAVEALLAMTESDWDPGGLEAVQMLRARRADSALLLAATEVALEPDPLRATDGLREIGRRLEDETWTSELGLSLARWATIGILSIGPATMKVLEAAVELGGATPELLCDRRAVARGMGILDLPIVVADPASAEAVLLPVSAQHKERVWTTERNAAIAVSARDAGRRVVIVRHPLADLSPLNRLAYRPRSYLTDLLI